jgi:cell division protein FtsB
VTTGPGRGTGATAAARTVRPTAGRRGRSRFTPGGAVLALVVVALLFAVAVPVRTLLQQRADLARMEQQAHALEQQNAALTHRTQQLDDPAYLERVARECLGMVKPGEIAFVVVPSGKPGSVPADPVEAAPAC